MGSWGFAASQGTKKSHPASQTHQGPMPFSHCSLSEPLVKILLYSVVQGRLTLELIRYQSTECHQFFNCDLQGYSSGIGVINAKISQLAVK